MEAGRLGRMRLPSPITSRTNARVKALRAAFLGKASQPGEAVGVEGLNLVGEAYRSRLNIEDIFVKQGSEDLVRGLTNLPVTVLSRDVFESVVDTRTPQGIAAIVQIPANGTAPRVSGNGTVLVLEDIQDPGNLGTLIRSAEAFGVETIFLTPGCANAWNPKVIRASAGSVFRARLVRLGLEQTMQQLSRSKVRIAAAVAKAEGAKSSMTASLQAPVAILIGNEGAGLSERALSFTEERVHIPCRTESLNAAIAGSLLMYEAQCQQLLVQQGAQPTDGEP